MRKIKVDMEKTERNPMSNLPFRFDILRSHFRQETYHITLVFDEFLHPLHVINASTELSLHARVVDTNKECLLLAASLRIKNGELLIEVQISTGAQFGNLRIALKAERNNGE
tara:strand:- start:1851 stop:2186 length:336 start_codon:yes stop_codon:yes gene_type:complete